MKNFSNRKGFTLVELLIVIVVIGVLSAMMMLSSTEAVSSAKAANVINNLRNIKTAVLSWYTDNLDRIKLDKDQNYKIDGGNFSAFVQNKKSEILKYLNNDSSINIKNKNDNTLNNGDYLLTTIAGSKYWYICYYVGNDKSLQAKLASRAKTAELFGENAKDFRKDLNSTKCDTYYTNQNFACMFVLSLVD
ncbi:MAG: type II secretion system protein [Synergistales bacterium]|nr:type II secretion system protein [Synergistales bacterium]MDY6401940.1 type II secretion system protein [Synergistales bacterium]MDY6405194.1 type II secretion system protein [Synergistales bacterium]MDY6410036.1 type II secretion system protein [Synergistales bacterium]MDY6414980.1 type II secretion system protein [Synergistales bacterium]